jgi:hypothetical protein
MAATASFASESDYQAVEKRWRGSRDKAKTAEKAQFTQRK